MILDETKSSNEAPKKDWAVAVIYNEARTHYVMVFPQEFREGGGFNDYVQDGIVPIACEVCP